MSRHRLAGAVVALVVVLVAGACSDDAPNREEGTSGVVSSGSESVFSLYPGDCIEKVKDKIDEVSSIGLVPCKDEHVLEVFRVYDLALGLDLESPDEEPSGDPDEDRLDSSDYPGREELESRADAICLGRFQDYTGIDYFKPDSGLYFSYLIPTIDSWTDRDDRQVVCVVGTTGSALLDDTVLDVGDGPLPTVTQPPEDGGDG